MFDLFARYATEVVQSYGEGVLWWGVKNVDYLQPELMNAANDYSDRFNSQMGDSIKYIMIRSPSNPIYKIIKFLLEDLVKKHGKDKVIKAVKKHGLSIIGKTSLHYGLRLKTVR